jgi:hypothetical protein
MNTWLQEVTDWDMPNHTYILNAAGHCVGYVKRNTTDVIMFNNPLKQFSKSRRKFKKVKAYVGN